ncbi:MAG: site-specific integrase [Acidaminococcaceae bacterium]|nr:site-specific integrase [Acidaminococcaceae bacterium]
MMGTRNKNGEGSNPARGKDGRLHIWISYKSPITGKTCRKRISGRTLTELYQRKREFTDELERGRDPSSAKWTLGKWIEHYLVEVEPTIKESTYKQLQSLLIKHAIRELGEIPLRKLTPAVLQKWLNGLRRKHSERTHKPLSWRSIKDIRGVLRTCLQAAMDEGHIAVNPVYRTRLPVNDEVARDKPIASPEQIAKMLYVAKQGSYHPPKSGGENPATAYMLRLTYVAVLLAFYTSAREGELFGLTWEDVWFDEGIVNIRQTLTQSKRLTTPKTKSSIRRIPVSKKAMSVLAAWKTYQDNFRKSWHGLYNNELNLVLPNSLGKPITIRNFMTRYYNPLRDYVGLPQRFTFHSLRHTSLSIIVAEHIETAVTQRRAGHSSSVTTEEYYIHQVAGRDRAAVHALDRAMDKVNLKLDVDGEKPEPDKPK